MGTPGGSSDELPLGEIMFHAALLDAPLAKEIVNKFCKNVFFSFCSAAGMYQYATSTSLQ